MSIRACLDSYSPIKKASDNTYTSPVAILTVTEVEWRRSDRHQWALEGAEGSGESGFTAEPPGVPRPGPERAGDGAAPGRTGTLPGRLSPESPVPVRREPGTVPLRAGLGVPGGSVRSLPSRSGESRDRCRSGPD